MSGGQLIVVDRYGRDVKRYQLAEGLATLGSDPACNIRVLMSSVSAHHATVVVHANQTFIRNIGDGETLVNGQPVSVSALCHGDMISIGGRSLRWEYSDPDTRRQSKANLQPALWTGGRGRAGRARARRSAGDGAPATLTRSPALRLALEMTHRASMPGSAGAGKQVAIVQPQRRDTSQQYDKNPPRTPLQTNKRRTKSDLETSTNDSESDNSKRKTTHRMSPKNVSNLQTTKATLWIESRKTSPRKSARAQTLTPVGAGVRRSMASKKSTPLRLTVLKRAQSTHKMKVTKIEDPVIDPTKQVAIMLMARHTPKKLSSPKSVKSAPSLVVKKSSPVLKTPAGKGRKATRRSKENATPANICPTPKGYAAVSNTSRRSSGRPDDQTDTVLEIADSDAQNITARSSNVSRQSSRRSISLPSPRKSALKNPTAKGNMRKSESIKFDLSNLRNQSNDVLMLNATTKRSYDRDSASDDELTLHYSDSSSVSPPTPRRSIHSRSSRMLEKALGTTIDFSPPSRALTPQSPRGRLSSRGNIILQKVIDKSEDGQTDSRRSPKSQSDRSQNTTNMSAYQTHILSPRTRNSNNLESYSIVDLVSTDSDETGTTSVYNSAGSANNTTFGTPQSNSERKTRSSINPKLLGSSTPYVVKTGEFTSNQSNDTTLSGTSNNISQVTARSSLRRSKSLSTPENTEDAKKHIAVNSNKITRPSKSRSRINDSDLLLVEGEDNDSPKSSKRSRGKSNPISPNKGHNQNSVIDSPQLNEGVTTPENRFSPEEATTPVLSIQTLLDSSHTSMSHKLQRSERQSKSSSGKRKTIGVVSEPKTRMGVKSKSLSFTARKTRLRLSSDSLQDFHKDDSMQQNKAKIVTPKSTFKLVHEGVKNKHSTAKKPQSKRAIIDDLNESDIVKNLFNSPVKRKLSQSMTEFSRKHLSDNDIIEQIKSPLGDTEVTTDKILENSVMEDMTSLTPERFVSPINTPSNSPNLTAIKRLFGKKTPRNDLENVRNVKDVRTSRTRRSIRNDLSNVTGMKSLFAKTPKNSLSDVQVKGLFASSPKNDLRRVTGVKTLFESKKKAKSPRNDLSDVRGVKKLFQGNKSPSNDLRNVSGVKRVLQRNSPRNDLSDVTGVKRIFRQDNQNQYNGLNNISGVEELFNTSNESYSKTDILFDQLVGKPSIKAVYSKTFSVKLPAKRKSNRKSLRESLDFIANNVDEWLEQELQKRFHKENEQTTSKVVNRSKSNLERELQKLATDTVEGNTQDRKSRVRDSTLKKSNERQKTASELYGAHRLPIKKRSLLERSNEKETNLSKITSLPIKKRAVIHSTPMKGRVNMTMNASELSRVSPIAAVGNINAEYDNVNRTAKEFSEPTMNPEPSKEGRRQTNTKKEETMLSPRKTRGRRKSAPSLTIKSKAKPNVAKPRQSGAFKGRKQTNVNNDDQATSSSMPSLKKTRGRHKSNTVKQTKPSFENPVKSRQTSASKKRVTTKMNNDNQVAPSSMQPAKITRGRSKANNYKTNSPKTKFNPAKSSPTISKIVRLKSNVRLSTAKANSSGVKAKSTAVTRATRSQKNIASPKNNAKKGRLSLVVSKKTPVMSPEPRSMRNKKISTLSEVTGKRTRTTRKLQAKENTPKITRNKVASTKAVLSQNANKTKVDTSQKSPKESRTNNVPKTISKKVVLEKQESTQSEPVRKGKRAVGTRGKKMELQASLQSEPPKRSLRSKPETVATVETRKRKIVDDVVPTKVVKLKDNAQSKSKKTNEANQDTVESIKGKRSVRSTRDIPTKGAKSKDIVENTEAKRTIRSTRGIVDSRTEKWTAETLDTEKENVNIKKKRSGKDSKSEISRQDSGNAERSTRSVRSKKAARVADEQQQETTGRKTRNTAESVSAVGKRKRKSTVEPSPSEAGGKQPRGERSRKAVEVASPAQSSRTRRRRADTEPGATKMPAGRSRRR